jgi:fermentation-respiration switch protein FrsA (DUF1100 family)
MGTILKEDFDLGRALGRLRRILVVHGEADLIVPPSHAREIFEGAQEPKRLIVQPKGDHRMSDPRHQQEFIHEAVLWFRRFL